MVHELYIPTGEAGFSLDHQRGGDGHGVCKVGVLHTSLRLLLRGNTATSAIVVFSYGNLCVFACPELGCGAVNIPRVRNIDYAHDRSLYEVVPYVSTVARRPK